MDTNRELLHIMEYIKDAFNEGFDSRIKERGRNVALNCYPVKGTGSRR